MQDQENEERMLVELTVDDLDNHFVDLISFVENPATESNFMYFSKEKKTKFSVVDEERRIVVGAAMIAGEKIERIDAEGNSYDVYFTAETIRKCQELYFKKGLLKETNVDHENSKIDNISIVESWIVENPEMDKSKHLGYASITQGSWFVAFKVDNDTLWSKVKSGAVQGFSVEGFFNQKVVDENHEVEMKMKAILDSCCSDIEKRHQIRLICE